MRSHFAQCRLRYHSSCSSFRGAGLFAMVKQNLSEFTPLPLRCHYGTNSEPLAHRLRPARGGCFAQYFGVFSILRICRFPVQLSITYKYEVYFQIPVLLLGRLPGQAALPNPHHVRPAQPHALRTGQTIVLPQPQAVSFSRGFPRNAE